MEVFESFIKGLYLLFSETSILIFVILSIIILLKERIIIDNFKFVIFMFSITFPFILLFLVKLFSTNFSLDGWLGFLGSYLGIIGTFGALYWKSNLEKNENSNIHDIDEYFTDINGEYIQNRTCLRIRKTNNKSMELTFKGKSRKFF